MSRRKPYTEIGIRRLKCFRCKERQAVHQWNICADDNVYRPLCVECDVELNALVLQWAGFPDAEEKLRRYTEKLS